MTAPVMVGLSGGVDSAVAALLLQQAGQRVEALFMFNWSEDEAGRCQAAEDYASAQTVCRQLDIPLHRADFSREYKQRVFSDFLAEYAAGRTPNPDIWCNREIKFDAFLSHAERLGAMAIATGHYARTERRDGATRLLRGADPGKDQSYFLAAVPQAALARTHFPLGDLHKNAVREIARRHGLANHARRDSTGVCFIGERDFAGFLQTYLPARPGPIRALDGPLAGRLMGEHRGLMFHTLGQRRGLGIGGLPEGDGRPWYVVDKQLHDNSLWVSQNPDHPALMQRELLASAPHWIGPAPALPLTCQAQVRYRQAAAACRVEARTPNRLAVRFERPLRAITPGQFVVFYEGDACLGGATIDALPELAATASA